jgi:SAM-dependent methyltransferase
MIALSERSHLAGRAFDSIAEKYDVLFTNSLIGRAQRAVVWERALTLFKEGGRVLELNCGTGEDAMFLAETGIAVTACDASACMIEQAASRRLPIGARGSAEFLVLPSERLHDLPASQRFDGALSNFSGLNCVSNLTVIATQLAARLDAGSPALLCLSTRFCAWEMLFYLAQGDKRAFRRCGGFHRAKIGRETFPVYYPTLRSISRSFAPFFRLQSVVGVGICVPPSYMESWAGRHRGLLRLCNWLDSIIRSWPGIRLLGDHMLLHLERV